MEKGPFAVPFLLQHGRLKETGEEAPVNRAWRFPTPARVGACAASRLAAVGAATAVAEAAVFRRQFPQAFAQIRVIMAPGRIAVALAVDSHQGTGPALG